MQSEQVLFEGLTCPVLQKFETRTEYIQRVMQERAEQKRNRELDRQAQKAAFMDRYEQGYTSF